MSILRYSDRTKYVMLREGIKLYYFGSGCIADYHLSSIAYLTDKDISILHYCTGQYTLQDVLVNYLQDEKATDAASEEAAYRRIEWFIKKGVLVLKRDIANSSISILGIKGMYYPKQLALELTNTCNYKCPFCYKNASTSGIFIDDAIIIRIERLIHNNIHNILLTGGEPTLHPHYLRYISLFSEYADVHMITNGSILYEHDAQELAKLKLIQFSIYGCDNAEYLKMTGMNDGFTRLVKSIEFVHSNSIHSILSLTICEETIDRIESFVQTAIGLNMSYLRIGIADRFGRGKYLYGNHNDFDRKKDSILHLILELKRKYRNRITIEISNIEKDHVSDHYDIYNNIHRGSLKCGCGSEYLVISHEGKLRPCQQLPERWFSIKSNTALEEHISGNFHIDQLYQNAHEYCVQEQKSGYDLPPCFALEDLMFKQNI